MSNLTQLAAVFAIAGGAGLLAFSRHIDPPLVSTASQEIVMSSATRSDREMAAMASGVGTAFVTLGGLTLAVPWINAILKQQTAPLPTITS